MSLFIDFTELHRPDTPNTYLLAPDGLCQNAKVDKISPLIRKSPQALFRRLVGMAGQRRDWINLESDEDKLRLVFVARSPLMRFKDDVDIMVLPVEGLAEGGPGAHLAVYSRSRVGYSDLGANRKRVSSLLALLPTR